MEILGNPTGRTPVPQRARRTVVSASVSLAALMAATVCATPSAYAENLADAVSLAYATNPTLISQRAQLRALDEQYVQARRSLRPAFNLDGVLRSTTSMPANEADTPAFLRTPHTDVTTSTVQLSATQLLSSFGRTTAEISLAEATVLGGRELLRRTEGDVLFNVLQAYAAVRRDEQVVTIRIATVGAFQRYVDQTKGRIQGGDATLTDLGQAEAQLSTSQIGLAQAQSQLEASRAAYAALVGQNPGTLEPEPNLAGLPADIGEAYDAAQEDSPIILQAVMNDRAGRAGIQAARAQWRPTLSMSGQYAYTGAAPFETKRIDREAIAGLSLSVPLTTGGYTRSLVREAESKEQALYADIETARRSVLQNVSGSWNQIVASDRQIVSGEIAVRAAQRSSEGARLEFREGNRSFFEVLNEEQRLLEAQLLVAQARYARFVGQAALLNGMGRLDAASIVDGVPTYDPKANFKKVRNAGAVPVLDPVISTLDRLTAPGDKPVRTPLAAPASGAAMKAGSATPGPNGVLGKALPVAPDPVANADQIGSLISEKSHERP